MSPGMFETTCTVARASTTKSAGGAYGVDEFAAIYTGLPCSLQHDSSSLTVEQKRMRGVRGATLFLSPKTLAGATVAIAMKDRITVGGLTWEAEGPSIDATAGRGIALRVPLEAPL